MVRYLVRHAGNVPDSLKQTGGTEKNIVHRGQPFPCIVDVDTSRREHWVDNLSRAVESAGFWSRWLLWSLPDLQKAKRHIEDRFGIVFV